MPKGAACVSVVVGPAVTHRRRDWAGDRGNAPYESSIARAPWIHEDLLMVGLSDAASIVIVALSLVIIPGPNMIYLVSRSITQGRCAGFISLAGVSAGLFVYLMAAVVGIARLIVLVPSLYTGIKIIGAVYLLWLAWSAARPGGKSAFTPEQVPAESSGKLLVKGMMTNLLNPKTAILYITVIPQFVDRERGHLALQILILGLIQIGVALAVNSLIVITAGSAARFIAQRPAWVRAERYITALALTGLAIRIVFS
jgi:threonine/homoserine/homoserine lactone efflux protein